MTNKQREVINAAAYWFGLKVPVGWTIQQHLENPGINCVTDAETRLAVAIAEYLKET
jgi:hypothetical protein